MGYAVRAGTGGQAVLTVRTLIKSGRFDRAWAGLMGDADTPANDNNRALGARHEPDQPSDPRIAMPDSHP